MAGNTIDGAGTGLVTADGSLAVEDNTITNSSWCGVEIRGDGHRLTGNTICQNAEDVLSGGGPSDVIDESNEICDWSP